MRKWKAIAIVLFSSFVGITTNPEMMTASDHVAVSGMDDSQVVKTIPLLEPKISTNAGDSYEMEPEYQVAEVGETEYVSYYEEPTYEEPVYQVPRNNIQIAGNTIELGWTDTTEENAGAAAFGWYYRTGKFIYAHNYSYVFGALETAYNNGSLNGTKFSVTMYGSTRYYTVTGSAVYTYNQTSAKMRSLINGGGHALVIMTCYGRNNERLVVYAD